MANIKIQKVGPNHFLFKDGLPVFKLNESGVFVLSRWLSKKTPEEIAREMQIEYSIDFETALSDASDLIEQIQL